MNILATIENMQSSMNEGDEIFRPSNSWVDLNNKNIDALKTHGIDNMRRTIARNYFTFTYDSAGKQYMKKSLPKKTHLINKLRALLGERRLREKKSADTPPVLLRRKHLYYVNMLFDYFQTIDTSHLLDHVNDSTLGATPPIYRKNKLISEDLINSLIEYKSISPFLDKELNRVLEVGAGYGRSASVFLQMHPGAQYVIVDIPPALFVSQEYLTKRFPEKRIFSFRPFNSFKEVEEEWNQADVCFLLPHQLKYLPKKSVDLFLNISSFHEMHMRQINAYFKEVDRLVNGLFYTKQWKISHLPQDRLIIFQEDYPTRPSWKNLFSKECLIQKKFFEELYQI